MSRATAGVDDSWSPSRRPWVLNVSIIIESRGICQTENTRVSSCTSVFALGATAAFVGVAVALPPSGATAGLSGSARARVDKPPVAPCTSVFALGATAGFVGVAVALPPSGATAGLSGSARARVDKPPVAPCTSVFASGATAGFVGVAVALPPSGATAGLSGSARARVDKPPVAPGVDKPPVAPGQRRRAWPDFRGTGLPAREETRPRWPCYFVGSGLNAALPGRVGIISFFLKLCLSYSTGPTVTSDTIVNVESTESPRRKIRGTSILGADQGGPTLCHSVAPFRL